VNTSKAQKIKRFFDLFLSVLLLAFLLLPGLVLALVLAIYFRENPIFIQERIGKNAQPFNLFKFRTIKGNIPVPLFKEMDRLSGLSKLMLRYKINELPQLVNIFLGHMSFTGPRPDVRGFADKLTGDDRILLEVKPGLTGPATLKYRDEIKLLSQQSDPVAYNKEVIWPDKVKINKDYIANWSFSEDVKILLKTVFHF
jgi:lipopolysaccharide/colanic/teichoic acid biosynthesis glycosyltransferase